MEEGTRAGTIGSQLVSASELLSRHTESVYSGEPWTIYVKTLHKCWPYLPSFRKVVLGQFFFCRSRLFFLCVRTSSVGTCSRYRKYVQQ